MNFLAHFALSDSNEDLVLGNFLGDFLRAGEDHTWPETVRRGIRLHRMIDCFTDEHPRIKVLRPLFPPPHRRVAGIILDVVFDHYLIHHWEEYYPRLNREMFIQWCYACLENRAQNFPPEGQRFFQFMASTDLLNRYATMEGVVLSLDQLALRLKQPNGLGGTLDTLKTLNTSLETAFLDFYPNLMSATASWIQSHPEPE